MRDVVFVGSGGVGKSTFWKRLQELHEPIAEIQVSHGASRSGAARGARLRNTVRYELSTDLDITMLEINSEDRKVQTVIYTTPGQPFVRNAQRMRETYAGKATGLVFMFSADEKNDETIEKQLNLIRREQHAYKTYNQKSLLIILNKVDTLDLTKEEDRRKVHQMEEQLMNFFKPLATDWEVVIYGPIRTSFAPEGRIGLEDDRVKKDIYNVLKWVTFVIGKSPFEKWEDLILNDSHWSGKTRHVLAMPY